MKALARLIPVVALLGTLVIPWQHVAAQGRPVSAPLGRWTFDRPTTARFHDPGTGSQPIGTDPKAPPATPVGINPLAVAVDDSTHTAYVSNGDNTVSVVDTTHCRAGDISGCNQTWPTVAVGNCPVSLAVNQTTHTAYVTNGCDANGNPMGTVSVIDLTTCNATNHSGCSDTPQTISVSSYFSDYVAIDQATNTIYVANDNIGGPSTVSVIDGTHCDAANTSGCGLTPPTVNVGVNAFGLAFDSVNRTVYVANCGSGSGPVGCASPSTVSMIDASACNAKVTSGCSQTPPTFAVPESAVAIDVDQSSNTVYVSQGGPSLGVVSVVNGANCNATTTSGCGSPHPLVTVGSGPFNVVADQQTHSVFVPSQEDSSVSVIDGTSCNAHTALTCSTTPLSITTGFDVAAAGLDPATQTLYVPSQDLNTVSVIDATSCTLTRQSGCRKAAPTTTVGNGPQGNAIDPSTGTLYVTNQDDNTLSLVNTATCNASVRSGCGRAWPTIPVGTIPKFITIDRTTHTAYIADVGDGIVWAFDVMRCNVNVQSGCQFHAITISADADYLDWMAVDDATHTLYVTDRNSDGLAMIDMSTCNAGNFSGCSQTPQFASTGTGSGPDGVVLDPASQSLYVADSGPPQMPDHTVSLLDASTCNVRVTSGCGVIGTVGVDSGPTRIALDQRTDTIFVASRYTDRVNVIDGRSCKVGNTSGCGTPVATISISQPNAGEVAHPTTITVDEGKDLIYLTDVVDSDIVVLNGATCNGRNTSGCSRRIGDLIRTGGWPSNITLDPSLGTGYNPDNVDGQVSEFPLVG